MIRLTLILILLGSWCHSQAQGELHIEKPGKVKRIVIKSGTEIKFQIKGDPRILKRELVEVRDSILVFPNFEVRIKEISMIRIPLHPRLRKYSETFIAAGTILFVADQLNNSVVNDNDFTLNRGVSIASLSLITGGVIMRFLQKRTYHFPGKHKLKTFIPQSDL